MSLYMLGPHTTFMMADSAWDWKLVTHESEVRKATFALTLAYSLDFR